MKFNTSLIAKVGVTALVLAAAATASVAQARSNVYFSVSGAVAPGVVIGASNAPVYAPAYGPAYYSPAPVYYSAAPVYAPAPVYYEPTYYVRPAPVVIGYGGYYGPRYRHNFHHHGHR